MKFNREKFKALVHYIVSKKGPIDHDTLCTVLWMIDTTAYGRLGHSITGADYIKGENCPIPVEPA